MTLPEPWNDKNNCFANDFSLITEEQSTKLNSIDTDNTTFIRSNLSITNGENTTIPNVFEAINTLYQMDAKLMYFIDELREAIKEIIARINAANI